MLENSIFSVGIKSITGSLLRSTLNHYLISYLVPWKTNCFHIQMRNYPFGLIRWHNLYSYFIRVLYFFVKYYSHMFHGHDFYSGRVCLSIFNLSHTVCIWWVYILVWMFKFKVHNLEWIDMFTNGHIWNQKITNINPTGHGLKHLLHAAWRGGRDPGAGVFRRARNIIKKLA